MFVCALLLSCCLARVAGRFDVGLEPGHVTEDYESMEEVRGHGNETETEKPAEDERSMREAVLDVAYYLRRFKFSGRDPRRFPEGADFRQNLFVQFPFPPLRNIHWEVKKNCEPSFVECVKYLRELVSRAVLPRHLDSLTITKRNRWSFITDVDLIKSADDECLKLLVADENMFDGFSGPLQRFQWLTSANYYMCLYAMKETPYLKTFAEDCDNYASCIQWEFGTNNGDVRANNGRPFACALYSFCPDPCCPLKHLTDRTSCEEASPCIGDSSARGACAFSRTNNVDMDSMILNRWNITCDCDRRGFRWDSKSGICVDVDECIELESACAFPSETCLNLPGSYDCICSPLGYSRNPETRACESDLFLRQFFYPPAPRPLNESESFPSRFSNELLTFFNKMGSVASTTLRNFTTPQNRTRVH